MNGRRLPAILTGCLALWGAVGATAEPFFLSYSGNSFPEDEGWNRFATQPVDRSLDNGILTLDALGDPQTWDVYHTERGAFSLDSGEWLQVKWRMRTTATEGIQDPERRRSARCE